MNLRDQLKASTAQSHARLDRELRAWDPFKDRAHYRVFLMLMLNLHQRCSNSLHYVESELGLPARQHCIKTLILTDLETLGHNRQASDSTFTTVDLGDSASPKSAETMLGEAYVLEGSAMGAKIMFRQAELSLPKESGSDYLRQLSHDAGERWKAFVRGLKAIEARGLETEKVVSAAGKVFDDAYSIFQALKSSDVLQPSSEPIQSSDLG